MKRSWILALMAFGISMPGVCADAPKSPARGVATITEPDDHESPIDKRIQTMTANLSLSKSQQDAIRRILSDFKAKRISLRNELEQKRKTLRADVDAKI